MAEGGDGLAGVAKDLAEEGGERLWQARQQPAAQPEPYFLLAGRDVAEGEAADHGRPLSVEENEQAGHAILRFDRVVMEQQGRACSQRALMSMTWSDHPT